MPPRDRGRVNYHERLLPARPPPSYAEPEQTVRSAKASIRTTKDRQLVTQGDNVEEQVSTRRQGRSECRDRRNGGMHHL